MKEFINKLIERLGEQPYEKDGGELFLNGNMEDCLPLRKVKEIATQLAEEYADCYKDCEQCEAYDKEKHHCPKFCMVIKDALAEIEENHNNDFCEWTEISVGGITAVKEPHGMKLFNHDHKQQFCHYCGKKIKVAPYQPKGE